jgi:hypothetical protein
VFWENGFKSVAALAAADVKDILPVLLIVRILLRFQGWRGIE